MSQKSYQEQDIKCCYTCSHSKIEAEGQAVIECQLGIQNIDFLGVCDWWQEVDL